MSHLGCRAIAVVLWTCSVVLMIISGESQSPHQLAYSNWAIWTGVLAANVTGALFLQNILEREADRNALMTADFVGDAVAAKVIAELEERGHLTRRDT